MRNTVSIALRDFKAYFFSPIAYIVTAMFLGIMGWMFFMSLSHFNLQALQYAQYNMGKGPSITDGIIRPVYGNMNVIFLFLVPFITMRLFAEEKKQHTLELLMTSPVTVTEIVFGKFLSAFLLVTAMLALTLVYPIVLILTGNPDVGPILGSYIGTLLLFSCYISLGMFFSSLTENQIVAGALGLGAALYFWLISWATQLAGPVWSDVLNYISLITHYNNFSQGVLNTTDVIYYLSFIAMGLFLTHRSLDSYRWR